MKMKMRMKMRIRQTNRSSWIHEGASFKSLVNAIQAPAVMERSREEIMQRLRLTSHPLLEPQNKSDFDDAENLSDGTARSSGDDSN